MKAGWRHMNNATGCMPMRDGLKSYDDALALLLDHAQPPAERQRLALRDCLGRVLAQPLVSAIDVPAWDNSAMDGYALRAADVPRAGIRLRVSQRIAAGSPAMPLQPGSAARIFTGAPVPEGADTVVIQERCERDGDTLMVGIEPQAGANINRAGQDIRRGAEIIAAGTRLLPQHIGLAASVGVPELDVYRPLRVALFSTGDELLMPGEKLTAGKIYNSNLFTATGLLQSLGCEVVDLGIIADTLQATREALASGAAQADLILASGGVSVGEEDHVKPAVESLGTLEMWKIAIRPGKPVAFGHISGTPFLGTPGNPVSLFVTFLLFARPFILRCQGRTDVMPRLIQVAMAADWPRADPRREFVRARLQQDDDGVLRVQVHPSRSSAVLSSVTWADGLAVIPENTPLKAGDRVGFLAFSELLR
jgi:molybdopterin molybdotransferase